MSKEKTRKKYIITFYLKEPKEKIVETSYFIDYKVAFYHIFNKRIFRNKAEIPFFVIFQNGEYISFPVERITKVIIRPTHQDEKLRKPVK